MFSKKATKFDKIFTVWRYVVSFKSTVKILSIFVAFLESMNFICTCFSDDVVNMEENQIMESTYTHIA